MSSTKRVSFVELAIRKCQLNYGEAPCTAAVGVTGERKCFNSRITCQDITNIDEADELIRFAKPSSNIRFDLDATPNSYLPNIQGISYTPATVDLGKSIGMRGVLTITFKDHASPDTDASGDKYRADRDYDPFERGTYWGKFRARHPFIRGQSIWWVQGTSEQLVESMERQQFVVESTAGPDSKGVYTIVAKDILKLTQGDRATAPVISQGATASSLTAGATSVTLSPGGVGSTYPSSGKAALGGVEIVNFTRSGDVITLTRGQNNTEAVAHDADVAFQLCLVYSAEKASDIFEDLLTTYTSITSAYIPLSDWENESDTQLNRVYSTVIAQPTPVTQLINELLEQTASSMYWDGFASLIRWTVLKKPDTDAAEFNTGNVMGGTFAIQDQLAKRVSQVWVWYGQINPVLSLSDQRNYASSLVRVDEDSEDNFDGVPAYREIYSRWILGDARDTASRLAELVLSRYATPPRRLGFRLLRDSVPTVPTLAGSYQFKNTFIQDDTGAETSLPIQVTSVNMGESAITVKAEEITFTQVEPLDPDNVNLYPSNGTLNYNIYDAYFAQTGQAPTASTVVNVFVEEGFLIGSGSTNAPAMTTGTGWPAGATVNLTNNGTIVGRGGNGGDGAGIEYVNTASETSLSVTSQPSNGAKGGDAFEALFDANITNNGIIGGGGGGGGGGQSGIAQNEENILVGPPGVGLYPSATAGNGGGGGAGYPAGSGGGSGARLYSSENHSDAGGVVIIIDPSANRASAGGLAGSLENGAAGVRSSYDLNQSEPATQSTTASGPVNGGGGDLGNGGEAGQQNVVTYTGGDSQTTVESLTRTGGAAGNAIDQNGGTVTFLVTGDIRGAIT